MSETSLGFKPMEEMDVAGKVVLLRIDINSPINPETKKIVNTNRIDKSLDTINWLKDQGARVAMIAHQGDTLDYQNLISMEEHSEILSEKLGYKVDYIDDVCGPAACEKVKNLVDGDVVLLGNLRYLSEEISTFEKAVKLEAEDMLNTYLVRSLGPLVDLYVNDAFAAAHRNAPSIVAFQQIKPSAAGPLFFREVQALTKVMEGPDHPSVFVLGGAKISDAFGMMEKVLSNGTADTILVSGVTGEIFLMAQGISLGETKEKFIKDRALDEFIEPAAGFLKNYPGKIICPVDLAYAEDGVRKELAVSGLPAEKMFMDIGSQTISLFKKHITSAGTIFVNGPAGVFEDPLFEKGTKDLWKAIASSDGYSVVGGGDSVSAAARFVNMDDLGYVCTAGGAMVRFLSGIKLPLIEAMKKAR